MDLSLLKELLPVLQACGVSRFKNDGVELEFHRPELAPTKAELAPGAAAAPANVPSPGAREGIATEKVEDVVLPQDLAEEMDFSKVLNWSSPDTNEGGVPLTNDGPLTSPEAEASSAD